MTVDTASGWRRQIPYVGGLFVVALVLRLGFVLFYEQFPAGRGDVIIYEAIGRSVAAGRGFLLPTTRSTGEPSAVVSTEGADAGPQVRMGPVFPLFLAAVYVTLGDSAAAVRVVQAIVGAVTVVLVVRVAWLAFGGPIARVAGAIAAVYPGLIVYTGMVLTETLFAFVLTACVWIAAEALRRRSSAWWAAEGVVLGAAILLRAEALIMAPLLVAGMALGDGGSRRRRRLALLCLAASLTVGVWTARNYYHFREFVLVATHGGTTLWITTMGWTDWKYDDPRYQALIDPDVSEIEQSRILQRAAVRNILDDPASYLRASVVRVFELWVGSHTTYLAGFTEGLRTYAARGEPGRVAVKGALLAFNTIVIVLAIPGLVRAVRTAGERRALVLLCLAPILAMTVVHFFLYSGARYHVPVLPFVAMFGAAGILRVWEMLRGRWPALDSIQIQG